MHISGSFKIKFKIIQKTTGKYGISKNIFFKLKTIFKVKDQ